MDISEYHFDNGAEIDYYQDSYNVGLSNSNIVLVSNHRLSIRRKLKESTSSYQTYRKFPDESEEIIFEGDLSSAITYANSQATIFKENMPPKKYISGPNTYAELGRIGLTILKQIKY